MIQYLPSENLMFKGLSNKPRKYTAVEAANIVTKMTIEHPVGDWARIFDELDIERHYDRTFAAMWALGF